LTVNHGAAAIFLNASVKFAAFPGGIHPAKVPIAAAIHPVAIADITGNRRKNLDFLENT